jgi:SAM-dependent methyltransferase
MNPKIAILEHGEMLFNGEPISSPELALYFMNSLKLETNGVYSMTSADQEIFVVENFDHPIIVQSLELKKKKLQMTAQYGLKFEIEIASLQLDSFDRILGLCPNGIRFVLNAKAQDQLFNLCDSFDDDSLTISGEQYFLETPWQAKDEVDDSPTFWNQSYENRSAAWDMNQVHPQIEVLWPRLKLAKSRVLILGCGKGHDANFVASQGHSVTAVDFSPVALAQAKAKYPDSGIHWVEHDALNLPTEWNADFDLIIEHTLFCAIDPELRADLVKSWRRCLAPRGQLMGVFFVNEKPIGPLYGTTEWELRKRLSPHFRFHLWGRAERSPENRENTELLILAQKL